MKYGTGKLEIDITDNTGFWIAYGETTYLIMNDNKMYLKEDGTRFTDYNTIKTLGELVESDLKKIRQILKEQLK